ncbi:MAG: IS110 family transposase [Nocardioidaceae bacterium]
MIEQNQTPAKRGASPTAGVDWASTEHAVAVVDPCGGQLERFTVAHTTAGLRELVRRLGRAGVAEVAIERPDGPVVDALLAGNLGVIVIAPNQVKNLRSRYGSAGNKDDGFDAYVLADTLRTDRGRLRPLTRDSDATMTLRMTVRARQDLVAARVAMANQLRAHLQTTLPGVIGLFRDIDSAITLRFLTRFPSQDKINWLSRTRLGNWLRSIGYNHLANLDRLWDDLHDAPLGTTGPEAAARAEITLALVASLTTLRAQIKALENQIADQLAAHPDAAIFTSLPRSGSVRAARLLAEIGDARGRFPTPEALTCLAGAAPSTRQSGKVKVVAFRWAVDKQLRGAVIDFAGDSHHANPWAADLYQRARTRGHDHPHAVRILARAWLHIIWRCWQDHIPYDPKRHRALQRLQQPAA